MSTTAKAAWLVVFALCVRVETQTGRPRPMRNDVPKAGHEILVLRNHELKPGGHEPFYQFSRDAYWPFFVRLGARVVGQWKVIVLDGRNAQGADDVYRLVRYASFEHWQATRQGPDVGLGGNGPAWENGQQGLGDRGGLQTGSKGAYFLEGVMAPDSPRFMPGLAKEYERVDAGQRPSAKAVSIALPQTPSPLMEGHMFQSPPVYLPGLPERYRPAK